MRSRTFRTDPLGEGLNIYRHGGRKGQLECVRRWHRRVEEIRFAEASGAEAERYLDTVYAFFQDCTHLADWVVHDLPGRSAAIEKLLAETPELRIARVISNATKHYELDRPPQVEGGFADGREYVPDGLPSASHPVRKQTWFVIANGEKYDIFLLAERCMEAWERFAEANDRA